MVTCTPRYSDDTGWLFWKRRLWLTWDEYLSPWGPKYCNQYINEKTRRYAATIDLIDRLIARYESENIKRYKKRIAWLRDARCALMP